LSKLEFKFQTPLHSKSCPVVPEICRGQVHVSRKERKKWEEEEEEKNTTTNNNNKKRSKNNKSPNVVWET
jgi:hypothetical protein